MNSCEETKLRTCELPKQPQASGTLPFYFFGFILTIMLKINAALFLCLATLALLSPAHADTPLELSMKKMSKAYKQLVLDLKQPQDASKPDYLTLVATLKTEAQTSRGFVPKKATELPADQQAAMVAAYQKSMDDLITSIDTLSQSIQAGQWDTANQQLATLKQQMFEGHKDFRKKEKE